MNRAGHGFGGRRRAVLWSRTSPVVGFSRRYGRLQIPGCRARIRTPDQRPIVARAGPRRTAADGPSHHFSLRPTHRRRPQHETRHHGRVIVKQRFMATPRSFELNQDPPPLLQRHVREKVLRTPVRIRPREVEPDLVARLARTEHVAESADGFDRDASERWDAASLRIQNLQTTRNPPSRAGYRKSNSLVATPSRFELPISTLTGWHVRPLHHGAVS